MLVKFRDKQFDISITQVYAPTTEANCDAMDSFYWGVDQGNFRGVNAKRLILLVHMV